VTEPIIPRFRNHDPRGHAIGMQSTKTDLVDIGRALGLNVTDRHTVPELRSMLRLRLETLCANKVLRALPALVTWKAGDPR